MWPQYDPVRNDRQSPSQRALLALFSVKSHLFQDLSLHPQIVLKHINQPKNWIHGKIRFEENSKSILYFLQTIQSEAEDVWMKKVCRLLSFKKTRKYEADILFSFEYPRLQSGLFAKSRVLILSFLQIWFCHVLSSLVGWYD